MNTAVLNPTVSNVSYSTNAGTDYSINTQAVSSTGEYLSLDIKEDIF